MRGERRLLRIGEYLIGRACRRLPAEIQDERYREWAAELPAILRDPDTRLAAHRAARMLRYAAGTIRGTALAPGRARRVLARMPLADRIFLIPAAMSLVINTWRAVLAPGDWVIYLFLVSAVGVLFGMARDIWRPSPASLPTTGSAEQEISAEQAISLARETADRFPCAMWRPGFFIDSISGRDRWFVVAACAGMTAVCVLLVIWGGTLGLIAGLPGVVFFGLLCLPYIVFRALRPGHELVVGADGFTVNTYALDHGFVSWDEVESITPTSLGASSCLVVKLRDPAAFSRRQRPVRRVLLRVRGKFGLATICISGVRLPLPVSDLVEIMEGRRSEPR